LGSSNQHAVIGRLSRPKDGVASLAYDRAILPAAKKKPDQSARQHRRDAARRYRAM